jgi:acyl transferase domain-containing protein/thioesterase domain-containing protein
VGLALSLPGAPDQRAFWDNLRSGRESIFPLDKEQLIAAGVAARTLNHPSYVRAAAYLDGMEDFDPEFFGFSPKEAAIMDPQHRHFLERCWEALEDAGHVPDRFAGSIGVFGGCGMGTYFSSNILSNPQLVQSTGLFLLRHTGNDKDFLTTRASYCFDLKGPSISVQTACSTSLVAAHLACQSLLMRECDLALAGGSTIELPHRHGYHYIEGEILSPDGHCRAFDAASKGTVFGSGSGVVALRRLADALRDGDHVYAVIRGSAVNNDGARKVGYLAPSVDGQAAAVAEALAMAGVKADEIGYVECHGTGTPVGDPIEVAALTQAFRLTTDRRAYCGLGSVKTNIGHLDTAAGVASLAKVALSLEHGHVPPSLHFERPNPAISFPDTPFFVDAQLRAWPQRGATLAGVNSLGVGGTNAFMVVERAPAPEPASAPSRERQLIVLSARTPAALDAACDRLAAHLKSQPALPLADVAHTLATGRRAFRHRRVLAAASREAAIELLETRDARRVATHAAAEQGPAVAFLLPGGGAQYPRMAAELYHAEPVFREHVDRGLALVEGKLDVDLRRIWFTPEEDLTAAARALERPSVQLPAIFIAEYALAQLWMSWGVQPKALLGHSLGENTAACLAGVMSFEDCLGLVILRGQLFETVPPGGMLSVPLHREDVEPLLGPDLDLGVLNGPELCVVSGPTAALDAFAVRLAERQVDAQRIPISIAAHSRMLDPILGRFGDYLRRIKLSPPRIPFLSNRTGTWITAEQATSPEYWVEHLRHTVQFSRCAARLLEDPNCIFLEVGPGRTLSALLRQQPSYRPEQASIPSLRHPDEQVNDHEFFLTAYGRLWACGRELDSKLLWPGERRQRVSLPTYPFQRQRYWIEPGAARALSADGVHTLERLPDLEEWGFESDWVDSPVTVLAASVKHTWLILMDDSGLGDAISRQLRSRGHEVLEVREGDSYHQATPNSYTLSPEHGRVGYDALVRDLIAAGKLPDRIVHLWLATSEEHFRPGSSFFHNNLESGYYSLFFLAQALGSEGVQNPIHWTVVTNGMQSVGDEALLYPEKAMILGPCKVIPREFAGFTCTSVDVDLPVQRPKRRAERGAFERAATLIAGQILLELDREPANEVVAIRNGLRKAQVHRARPLERPSSPARLRLVEGGAYLITGGFGGIGSVLAKHLARVKRARLILVSRTALPPRQEWASWLRVHGIEDSVSRRILLIRELEESGAEVMAVSADVTNLIAMRKVLSDAEERFGHLDGVFHAAGVIHDELILAKTQSQSEEVFAPKVHGTQVLATLFEDKELPLLVLFSSTSTVIAPTGQVDYVAANSFLNAFAQQQASRSERRVLAVNWGIWSGVGMSAQIVSQLNGDQVATPEVSRRPTRHPLLDARLDFKDEPPCFETSVGPGTHWLLDEHRTREGQALLPGTGFLELARAALAELGEAQPFEIRDLFLLRPLFVADDESRRVRLRLKPNDEGYQFEVLGRRQIEDGRKGWELHAQARLLLRPLDPPGQLDLVELDRRCGTSATAQYPGGMRTPQETVLRFGPRWRSLRQQGIGSGEALARLELPAQFIEDLDNYRIHPALVDVATGFAMNLIAGYGNPEELWIPFNYESVRIHGPLPRRIWSWVRVHEASGVDHSVASFDVSLADADGRVLVEVSRLSLKRAPASGAFNASKHPVAAELELDPLPVDAAAGRARSPAEMALQSNLEQGIRAEEGMAALDRMLSQDGPPVMTVSSLDLAALLDQADKIRTDAGYDGARFERPQLDRPYEAPRDELERTLVSFWQDLLGIERVGIEDGFFDLGGHSLIAVRLFARIKKTFHVDLSIATLFEAPTIASCAQLLRARIADSAGSEPRSEAQRTRYTHLVPMHSGQLGNKLPFFLVAGMFGNVLNLRHLAHLIGTDRPFYGLQARGLFGDQTPHEGFEEMARDYLKEIRTVQPLGPYLIGGFSGGGITAYEMAQQLLAAGEEVSLLILLDTPLPTKSNLGLLDRSRIHLQDLKRHGPSYLSAWAKKRVQWELARFQQQALGDEEASDPSNFRSKAIEKAFYQALDNYQLKPYPREVTLFRPRLDQAHRLPGNRVANSLRELVWEDNGWSQHVAKVEVFEVPGNHDSMVLEPNVRVLAALLRTCILKAEAGRATAAAIPHTRA